MITTACYVICDKCGYPAPISTEGAEIARKYAKHESGFIRTNKEDLCPNCQKKNGAA